MGTKLEPCTWQKQCRGEWGWNTSLSSIPNLGFCKSLIYLFCAGPMHPSAFAAPRKKREEGQDSLMWFHKAKVVPPASWQRQNEQIASLCSITSTNSAGWSLRWHNIFLRDTHSRKQVFRLSWWHVHRGDYACLRTMAPFSKPGAHFQGLPWNPCLVQALLLLHFRDICPLPFL